MHERVHVAMGRLKTREWKCDTVKNAKVKNAEWKNREQIAGVENAGVQNAGVRGGNCRCRLAVWKAEPILYIDTALRYFLKIVFRLLSERVIFIAF